METTTPSKTHVALFWALVLLAPLPGLGVYLSWLSDLEQYGYVLPLLLALGALVLFRWDYQLRMPSDPIALGLVIAGSSAALFAAYRTTPWFSAVGFALVCCGWLRSHWSAEPKGLRLTYLALLLLMLIRLPLNLDIALTTRLQQLTSRACSYLLDTLGVTHYLRGNVIELPSGTLFVEEACSGVQSLFTVLFLVCLWIVYRRRPILSVPVYLAAGVVWATMMNIVRITTIALALDWYAFDLSTGTPHEVLGWICLGCAVLMMLSTDRLIRVMFYPIPPLESGRLGNPMARIWNELLLVGIPQDRSAEELPESKEVPSERWTAKPLPIPAAGLLAVFSIICIPTFALGYRVVQTRFGDIAASGDKALLWEPGAELLKSTSYAGQVTSHQMLRDADNKQLGNHADVWTVVLDGIVVRVAVSQPYPEWHDMRLCYSGNGWQLNKWLPSLVLSAEGEGDGERTASRKEIQWPISYAELVSDGGDFGTLLFCGLTQDRETLSPPMSGLYSLLGNRMKNRGALQSDVIMLQLWTETQQPVLPEQLESMQELFKCFRREVLQGLGGPVDPQHENDSENRLTMTLSSGGTP